jgi:hypothetical protein
VRFWLISGDGPGRPEEPLTVKFGDGSTALAVFSFEEEARLFLQLGGRGWRVRAAGVGELVSMLSDFAVGAELVALDPLPQARGIRAADAPSPETRRRPLQRRKIGGGRRPPRRSTRAKRLPPARTAWFSVWRVVWARRG